MVAVEIILILIGVAFLVGSFFVEERFSKKDLEAISKMSEAELNVIVEKQVNAARNQVEDALDEIIDESLATTKRGLEKETNEKIMAVSEYSDTVLETINKTHNEVMFLYSMLNDKQSEMTEVVGALQKYSKETKISQPIQEEEIIVEKKTKKKSKNKPNEPETHVTAREQLDRLEDELVGIQETLFVNKNDEILRLHKEGKTEVEIAKMLDCGLGEVRLVLGLYKEI